METAAYGFLFALGIVAALEVIPRDWKEVAGGLMVALTIAIIAMQILGAF